MNAQRLHAAAFASALLLTAAPAAMAQVTGGSGGGVQGRNVSAATYGAGTITQNGGVGVAGGAAAEAVDGSASTGADARIDQRRGALRTTAEAQTEDERARSRTRVNVNPNQETVRSSTTSRYKERGSAPVRETVRTVTTPDGTETRTKSKGPK
jgi:hypothetical protein